MARYAARRALHALVMLLATTALVHVAMFVLPGDPIRPQFGVHTPDPAVLAAERAKWGLDLPWPVQYLSLLRRLASGDLGRSYLGWDVRERIQSVYPATVRIVLVALLFQAGAGVLLGMLSVRRPHGLLDRVVSGSVLLVVSVPVVVISVLAADAMPWVRQHEAIEQILLPGLVLGSVSAALVVRLTKASLREQLREPYVRTAAAKGLAPGSVVRRHALRNALPTVVAFLGADLAAMASTLPVVEKAFYLDGLGRVVVDAARANDTAPLVSVVMLFVAVALVGNLLADLLAAALDPRRRL